MVSEGPCCRPLPEPSPVRAAGRPFLDPVAWGPPEPRTAHRGGVMVQTSVVFLLCLPRRPGGCQWTQACPVRVGEEGRRRGRRPPWSPCGTFEAGQCWGHRVLRGSAQSAVSAAVSYCQSTDILNSERAFLPERSRSLMKRRSAKQGAFADEGLWPGRFRLCAQTWITVSLLRRSTEKRCCPLSSGPLRVPGSGARAAEPCAHLGLACRPGPSLPLPRARAPASDCRFRLPCRVSAFSCLLP